MASRTKDCDCGFVDSDDPTQSIFTSLMVVDFTSATTQQVDDLFIKATYEVSKPDSPYTRKFSADQVQISAAGLDLTVSPSADGESVPCAQVFSQATTFSYGSYRARFLVQDVPGTVTAFFNYKNDTSEVDIEFLSWKDPTLLYSVKPQIYSSSGTPSNSTYQQQRWSGSSASFGRDFHEWSFVWLPEIVHFGLDGNYSRNITVNVPQAPGRMALNHWSNGDPNYSLGPPEMNSTVTVSFVQAVYNDTSVPELACHKATSACIVKDGIIQGNPSWGEGANASPTLTLTSPCRMIAPAAQGWLSLLLLLFLL